MLRFEKFSQRSQRQLPVACEVTAMAAHEDEGLPDFEGFFDEEWMDEQIEVGNCVFCYICCCLCITSEPTFSDVVLLCFQIFIFMSGHEQNKMRPTDSNRPTFDFLIAYLTDLFRL